MDSPLSTANLFLAFFLLVPSNLNCQSFILRSRDGLSWLEAPNLISFPSIVHAFSTRAAGDFRSTSAAGSVGLSSHPGLDVEGERRRFLSALHAECFEFASVRQIHSAQAVLVTQKEGTLAYDDCRFLPGEFAGAGRPAADALITSESGVLLAIRTADCLPVLIADARRGAIAAVHAGWRGALESVVENAVHEMRWTFNSAPLDLVVALGPSIRACCYVVGPEVVDAFCSRFARGPRFFHAPARAHDSSNSHSCLDLVAVAVDQLERAGVARSQIEIADFCTSCRTDLFFSHRKEGAAAGRMLAVIGIREEFPSAGARLTERGSNDV
jgi:YfiH family protein